MSYRLHVSVIRLFVVYGKGIYAQTFTCLYKSVSRCLFADIASLQEFDPFVEWSLRHLVEVVNPQHVILREHISCAFPLHYVQFLFPEELLVLSYRQLQFIVRLVHTSEFRSAVIHVVLALSEFKVYDIHRIHLSHLVVRFAQSDILRYGFRHAVQHSVEVRQFVAVLHLYYAEFALLAFSQYVHAVVFVLLVFLVAFAFEESVYFEFHSDQRRQESLQYGVVSLVAQQAFHCPVESDIIFSVLYHANR